MTWGMFAMFVTIVGVIIVALALARYGSDNPPARDGFWLGVCIAAAPWLCIFLAWSRL